MSREAFAAHTGVSAEAVRKWERRRETIELTAPYAARMDRKLRQADVVDVERFSSILSGTDGADVDAGHQHVTPTEVDSGTKDVLVTTRTATGEIVLVSVPRRTFVAGLGAGAVGMAADAALSAKPLIAAFARDDIDHIKFFREKRMNIIESDNIYGAASTLPEVLTSINRMQLLRQAKVVDSQSILRQLAIYAETAAWQCQ